jgi:hypothetical protein
MNPHKIFFVFVLATVRKKPAARAFSLECGLFSESTSGHGP